MTNLSGSGTLGARGGAVKPYHIPILAHFSTKVNKGRKFRNLFGNWTTFDLEKTDSAGYNYHQAVMVMSARKRKGMKNRCFM